MQSDCVTSYAQFRDIRSTPDACTRDASCRNIEDIGCACSKIGSLSRYRSDFESHPDLPISAIVTLRYCVYIYYTFVQ